MSGIDAATDGDFWGVVSETFGNAMPEPLFVGVVVSLVLMAIYMNSKSIVLTGVTAMLAGAMIVEFLPPELQTAGYLIILASVVVVAVQIYTGRQSQPY